MVMSLLQALMVAMMAGISTFTGVTADPAHYTARIINRLGPEEMNNVACTYKTPLGVYSVANEKDVQWDLPIGDDEPFQCTFYWQNKFMEGPLFILSRQGTNCLPGNRCDWELRPDGVYFMSLASAGKGGERILQWQE